MTEERIVRRHRVTQALTPHGVADGVEATYIPACLGRSPAPGNGHACLLEAAGRAGLAAGCPAP